WVRKSVAVPGSVAIDHRDIVMVSSPDGVTWSPKVRVNDDTGFTDQAFPEVVVDGDGGVHVSWYDRRFDTHCRALADFMMASTFDGGTTFAPSVRVTSGSSWWEVSADAIPNFGDQFRPEAVGNRLHLAWADGRGGDPDVRFAALGTAFELNVPSQVSAHVGEGLGLTGKIRN